MLYPLALGIDPGLRAFGYAVVEVRGDDFAVVTMGRFATEKNPNKQDIYEADDNLRRARELSANVHTLFGEQTGISVVCAEAMSHPMFVNRATGQRNVLASVAGQLSLAWGVVAAHVTLRNLPLVQATPQTLKKAVCGRRDATKDDMKAALDRLFGEDLALKYLKPFRVPKDGYEHAYDALASVIALRESDVFLMVRQSAKRIAMDRIAAV